MATLDTLLNGSTFATQRTKINAAIDEINKTLEVNALSNWSTATITQEVDPNTMNTVTIDTTNVTTLNLTLSGDGTAAILIEKTGFTLANPSAGKKLGSAGLDDISEDLILWTITKIGSETIHSCVSVEAI